jgi:hypothetical protein
VTLIATAYSRPSPSAGTSSADQKRRPPVRCSMLDLKSFVLLDEVETLAADRQRMSLEASPIDVPRRKSAVATSIRLVLSVPGGPKYQHPLEYPRRVGKLLCISSSLYFIITGRSYQL